MVPKKPPSSLQSPRRLGLHHLAFFRSHFEGLGLATLGERYLDTGADLPKAKATLRWVGAELIAAPRKEQPALVKLLKIPLARLSPPDQATPSLEDFQAQHAPHGFFDERELIALFQQTYPIVNPAAARKARRNDRLRRRLREAILWLEPRVATAPRPGDLVLAWLDEAVAMRLMAGGIHTLADLTRIIAKRGRHWHRPLPHIGPVSARRIENWLEKVFVLADGDVFSGVKVLIAGARHEIA